MILVEGLSKTFSGDRDGRAAIDGVDLSIGDGEIYVLLGPSGCGKTTLLRCVAGVEQPDRGKIEFDGSLVYSSADKVMVPCHRRDIGLVFQSYAIWPHMTVNENIGYPLRYGSHRRLGEKQVHERVDQALATVGMEGMGARMATELSGGQQQRVALARAVIHQPRLLLMDEPLSNLDARLRAEMRKQLVELLSRLRITTLYVTHDQVEAYSLAHRMGVMRAGQIVQEGAPTQIYHRPRTQFIADFTGEMNWLDGVVEAVDEGALRVRTAVGMLLARHWQDGLERGDGVVLGIRSADVRLVIPESGENEIRGDVKSVLFCGEWSLLELECRGWRFEMMTLERVGVPTPGCGVTVSVPSQCVCVFPQQEPAGGEMGMLKAGEMPEFTASK